MTVFVNGHAYLAGGGFSTATTIIDMGTGESLGNLESFKVFKDGERIEGVDFNFWGVTFAADPNRFYATLRTEGHYYLVEGNLALHEMRVLRDRVECPSLSPDGRRIAYKSRIGDENRWRLKVLDPEDAEGASRRRAAADRRPARVAQRLDPGLFRWPGHLHGRRRRLRRTAPRPRRRVLSGVPKPERRAGEKTRPEPPVEG